MPLNLMTNHINILKWYHEDTKSKLKTKNKQQCASNSCRASLDREAYRLVEHISGHLQNHFHGGFPGGKRNGRRNKHLKGDLSHWLPWNGLGTSTISIFTLGVGSVFRDGCFTIPIWHWTVAGFLEGHWFLVHIGSPKKLGSDYQLSNAAAAIIAAEGELAP